MLRGEQKGKGQKAVNANSNIKSKKIHSLPYYIKRKNNNNLLSRTNKARKEKNHKVNYKVQGAKFRNPSQFV